MFVGALLTAPAQEELRVDYRLVFWNVENLFDTQDDTLKNDDDFTPKGELHWNTRRYNTKLHHLYQTLVALGGVDGERFHMPDIVGMAEVENGRVLRDLCRGTALRRFGYDFIHFDSPDKRGIDNALLYRHDRFRPLRSRAVCVSDSARGLYTRDLLCVEGVLAAGDSLCLIVCHLPSKRGGTVADRQREGVARRMRQLMDTLALQHPTAAVVVMGDFNSDPQELAPVLTPDSSFVNLMAAASPAARGSYFYQGAWSWLDQVLVSRNLLGNGGGALKVRQEHGSVFDIDFLLMDSPRHLERAPRRTYQGMKYVGGYSDHLPVYIDLYRMP